MIVVWLFALLGGKGLNHDLGGLCHHHIRARMYQRVAIIIMLYAGIVRAVSSLSQGSMGYKKVESSFP